METLSEYEKITKKILLHMNRNNRFPADIINKIIKDNDAFYNIVSKVMEADWKLDINKSSKQNYRYKYCSWGVKAYISKIYNNKKVMKYSSNYDSYLPDKKSEPSKEIENKEIQEKILQELYNLEEKYYNVIHKYYINNMSYQKIATELNCTRENVRKIMINGMRILKERLRKYAI